MLSDKNRLLKSRLFSYIFFLFNRQRPRRPTLWLAVLVGLLLSWGVPAIAQDFPLEAAPAAPAAAAEEPEREVYFADVRVRGRPILQIGSLSNLSASDRADTINRRIASLLMGDESPGTVTVQVRPDDESATLQLNNRVLMTVTRQDAQDFGTTVPELAEDWADRLNQSLNQPPLAIDVVQRLNTTVRDLLRNTVENLPALIGALIVLVVTWAIAGIVRQIAFRWAQRTEGDQGTEILIGRLGYGAVWIIGTLVALGVMGLNFGALLGALGLTSVAIGFSLKDVLSNYISGVVLLSARPFRLGDQVVIDTFEGTIKQIDLRATTMTTYDGREIYIPNQEVFQASITNNTASPRRRSCFMVGIDYNSDISLAIETILKTVKQVNLVEAKPAPEVLVRELAASTVNLEVRFWVDSRRAGFLTTTSHVIQAVKENLQKVEIDMPTEIYTIVMR